MSRNPLGPILSYLILTFAAMQLAPALGGLMVVLAMMWVIMKVGAPFGEKSEVADGFSDEIEDGDSTFYEPMFDDGLVSAENSIPFDEAPQAHIEAVQQRVNNLLLSCEHLVGDTQLENNILYQQFAVVGGLQSKYKDEFVAQLRESQLALDRIFELRKHLLNPDVQAKRPEIQRIRDWETLYVSIVGAQTHIWELNERELHSLLDPWIKNLSREEQTGLMNQLDALYREFEDAPLAINLWEVDPTEFDDEGILGNIEWMQNTIFALDENAESKFDHLKHHLGQKDSDIDSAETNNPNTLDNSSQ